MNQVTHLLKRLPLLAVVAMCLVCLPAKASHIVGGEITYQCHGNGYYSVQLRLFRDCTGAAAMPTSASITVRNGNGGFVGSYTAYRDTIHFLNISRPACATLAPGFCVQTALFTLDSISLGTSLSGLNFYYQVCCRNANISNVSSASSKGITITTSTNHTIPCNNSPYFNHNPPLVIPYNVPLNIDASAVDSDGDSLYYQLCTPFDRNPSTPPFDSITFSGTNHSKYPIPSSPPFTIDPLTGIMTGTISQVGNYLVSICVLEYRNGIYIGKIQRDYQFNAIQAWTLFASIPASNVVHPTCNGYNNGSIAVNVVGGTAPFTYQWSNSANTSSLSNLGPGNYSVIVTDINNCVDTVDVTLNQPPLLALNILSNTPASCPSSNDGAAEVAVSGGTSPYTLIWDSGTPGTKDSLLAPGPHKIYVADSAGCWDSLVLNIGVLSNLAVNVDSIKNPSCPGSTDGYLAVSFSGGAAPYNHLWSDSVGGTVRSGLAAGNLTIYLADSAGCYDSLEIQLREPQPLSITLDGLNHVSCAGAQNGKVFISVQGGKAPYSFSWNGNPSTEDISNLGPGPAIVVLTDVNGCSTTDTFLIQAPDPLLVDSVASVDATCSGTANGSASLTISGGRQPYTVNWSNNQSGPINNALPVGNYTYVVTDSSGCQVAGSVGIASPPALQSALLAIAPVSCPGNSDGSVSISASGGLPPYQYLWQGSAAGGNKNAQLAAGQGFVVVADANGCEDTITYTVPQPDTLKIRLDSIQHVNCFGGADGYLQTAVTGGVPPIQLSWSHGPQSTQAASLSSGSYTLVTTDSKGCITSRKFVITEPTEFLVTVDSVVFTSCQSAYDGEIHFILSGGTAPYSIIANTGDTSGYSLLNMPMGNHSVKVRDDHGCQRLIQVTIGKKDPLIFEDLEIRPPICPGGDDGFAQPFVQGGQPPYTFHWSNGKIGDFQDNLKAGWYEVSVVDKDNCYLDTSFYVPQVFPPHLAVKEKKSTCMEKADAELYLQVSGSDKTYEYYVDSLPIDVLNGKLLAGTHLLMAVDEDGCVLTENFKISSRMERIVFFPNAFTPNDDGLNDHFKIVGDEDCFPNPSFKVFNRWGEVIFSTHQPFKEAWDGFVGSTRAKEDTYLYKFESDHYYKKGIVTVFY